MVAILALIFFTSDDLICEWLDGNYIVIAWTSLFSCFKNGKQKS